jgi:hypothetical protein
MIRKKRSQVRLVLSEHDYSLLPVGTVWHRKNSIRLAIGVQLGPHPD